MGFYRLANPIQREYNDLSEARAKTAEARAKWSPHTMLVKVVSTVTNGKVAAESRECYFVVANPDRNAKDNRAEDAISFCVQESERLPVTFLVCEEIG